MRFPRDMRQNSPGLFIRAGFLPIKVDDLRISQKTTSPTALMGTASKSTYLIVLSDMFFHTIYKSTPPAELGVPV